MERIVRRFVPTAGSLLLLAGMIAFFDGRVPIVGSFAIIVFGLLLFAVYFYPGVRPIRALYLLVLWLFVFWGVYHVYFEASGQGRVSVLGGFIAILLLIATFNAKRLSLNTRSAAGDSLYVVALFLLPTSVVSSKGGLISGLFELFNWGLRTAPNPAPEWFLSVVETIADFFRYEYAAYGLLMLAYLTEKREKFPKQARVPPAVVQLTLTIGAFVSMILMLVRAISALLVSNYQQFFSSLAMGFFALGLFWIGVNSFREGADSEG